jgi:hypothetical protein
MGYILGADRHIVGYIDHTVGFAHTLPDQTGSEVGMPLVFGTMMVDDNLDHTDCLVDHTHHRTGWIHTLLLDQIDSVVRRSAHAIVQLRVLLLALGLVYPTSHLQDVHLKK